MCVCVCVCVCVCDVYLNSYCLIGNNDRLQYFKVLLVEMCVNVVFVMSCLYSTVSLTLVRE